jgi:mannose-6-phosphate isomerase
MLTAPTAMSGFPSSSSQESVPAPSAASSTGAATTASAPSTRSERPWGWFETLTAGEGYLVKRLLIRAGRRISLQRHRHRCEHWVVVGGDGELELDGNSTPAAVGTTLFVAEGAWHRATAGASDLLIIEVQRGADLREDDIERRADDYGRAPA